MGIEKITNANREFLFSHEELSRHKRNDWVSNQPYFQMDYRQGKLDEYKGTFVAYHKGVMCGQSADGQKLYSEAEQYYGKSNLAVFRVPKTWEEMETAIQESRGELDCWVIDH